MPEKPLAWVGSALDDLRRFPEDARQRAGFQLDRVQRGFMPDDWKAVASVGTGVMEIRIRTGVAHRIFYIAKFAEAVYVLHAFEKRTRQTSQVDLEVAKRRSTEVIRARQQRKER